MLKKSDITPEVLRQLLVYNPLTGEFFWRPRTPSWFLNEADCRRWNTKNAGERTFCTIDVHGYAYGKISGVVFKAHRAAWAIEKGYIPDQIDHINGVKSDNVFTNLRPATHHINGKNRPRNRNNTSGTVGVYKVDLGNRWRALIIVSGTRIDLGRFATFEAAVAARKAAEKQYGFHPNHGR